MKKIIALLLAVMMLFALVACGDKEDSVEAPIEEPSVEEIETPAVEEEPIATPEPTELPEIDKLTDAALEETEFAVLCSCSENMLKAAAAEFQAIYGIPVSYKCVSVAEAAAAVEAGSAGADVWMGAPAAVLDKAAAAGLLSPYQAENTGNLLSDSFKSADGSWYGIYADVLGFIFKAGAADSIPSGWDALNADTTRISLLDGSGAAAVESGECAVAAGGLSFGVARALAGGSLDFAVPKGELKCLLSGAGIINGCAHEDAAKLWMEFVLSSDFANPAGLAGMGLFPVVANSDMPAVAAALEMDIAKAKAAALDGSEDLAALAEKLK